MTILATLAFLVLAALIFYLASRLQASNEKAVDGGSHNALAVFMLRFLLILVTFLQLWVLTRFFSFTLIMVLVGAQLVGSVLQQLMGALAGFQLEEKQRKIKALTAIWTVRRMVDAPALGCAFVLLSTLALLGGWIISLRMFWTRDLGDPGATITIAFCLFAWGCPTDC